MPFACTPLYLTLLLVMWNTDEGGDHFPRRCDLVLYGSLSHLLTQLSKVMLLRVFQTTVMSTRVRELPVVARAA
jgi:hypothetical protein